MINHYATLKKMVIGSIMNKKEKLCNEFNDALGPVLCPEIRNAESCILWRPHEGNSRSWVQRTWVWCVQTLDSPKRPRLPNFGSDNRWISDNKNR